MRDTGTRSAQTAGCGQKSSKGYRLKQDYWLHRVAGDIQQGYCLPAPEYCRFRSVYRFLSVAGPGALLVTEESVVPASNPVLTTGLPVPECCLLRRVAGSGTGVLLVTRNLLFPSLLARNHLQIQC